MKTIKLCLCVAACGMLAVACSDTKDCKCTVEIPTKATVEKAERTINFTDWDTDCSKISTDDLESGQVLKDPCEEL
jgi:hypothetical protein